ncbi:MAG TPA: ABC transporter ATP-binding protein [Actinomycetota bacterium]|jgi:branched-chain amino acid transport system ATP-binding protein|nr:ABC transporter ATP-binding protein [Actinomycetota bacterium]
MSNVLLEATGLRAGFGSNTVLHGVSFDVREGEIGAILGLNGAGKSVTLKVVGGIVPAWQGKLAFAGEDITRLGAEQRVERGMAHVPQGRQVFPELTVEQNLRLGAYTLRRRDKSRYQNVLESILDRFPILGDRRSQAAGTLSGGEQAMLAVGRALMCEPKLILVDEASAGLAPIMVRELFDMLGQVNRSGVTILLVEQNVTFSLDIADRAHIMQRGQIVYEGDVPSLDTKKVATYLGVGRLLGTGVTAAVRRRGRSAPTSKAKTKRKTTTARRRAPR